MRNASSIFAFTLVIAASVARAQIPIEALSPVDQAIEDLDPLSTSLRVREPGLMLLGQDSSLFEIPADLLDQGAGAGATGRRYYRVGPGYVARVARIDYAIPVGRRSFLVNQQPIEDGDFIELVPPDTVFELTSILAGEYEPLLQPLEAPNPARVEAVSIYDLPLELGTWQRPLSRPARGGPRRAEEESESPARTFNLSSPPVQPAGQALGAPLDYRVDFQTGQGFAPQTVTPVDLRPMLKRREELRRQREAAEKKEPQE